MPAFIARILWGQMGRETLLASARVIPEKLLAEGFEFQHETLVSALKDLLGRNGEPENQRKHHLNTR